MPVIASSDAARATRRRASSNGTQFWLTTFIGANRYTAGAGAPPEPGAIYPMAFLVEQDADEVVGAHYHQSDQFQVMVGGSGHLGLHGVAPPTVHFAGAFSPYGPLRAGGGGLHYFTLRNGWDSGARYMESPDNRAALRRLPRRHREVVGETDAPGHDGFSSRRLRVAGGACAAGPEPATGAGQFWLVLSGALLHGGEALAEKSCVFVYPDEAPFAAEAGVDGAEVMVVQFPRQSS
jgi:hypothetical protein